MRKEPVAIISLIAVTGVWGSTFVLMKDAIERQPEMDFLATRFLLAALCMFIARPTALRSLSRTHVLRGVLLGTALGLGYITQTFGLAQTSAAVSGFITGMFVVFTPVIAALILRRPIGLFAWLAVLIATCGLALISLRGWSIGIGEALTVICALMFAIHIVGLGEWSTSSTAYALAVVQISTVGVLCGAMSLSNGYQAPPDGRVWFAVVLTAVLATAVAFFVQTWAQSLIAPTRAAVIMTMEPVFAGFFAVLVGGESLTVRTILGGALVVGAMYLVELGPRRRGEVRVEPALPHLEP